MTDNDQYVQYLSQRSRLGALYRKYWLNPRQSPRHVGSTLDLGCGIGDMLGYRSNTVGVEVNPRTVEYCNARGLEAHLMRPNELPFPEGRFDSVLMGNVLEHLSEPAPLLTEFHRVLAKEGHLLVGVPSSRGWAIYRDHKVLYDVSSLVDRVQRFGFRHVETFHTPIWRSTWLDQNMRQHCIYASYVRVD